jgi:hypothetical protein
LGVDIDTCKIHLGEPLKVYARGDGRKRKGVCPLCERARKRKSHQDFKKKLVDSFGGACVICGYSNYIGALEFHHRDPKLKEFGLGSYRGVNFDKAYEEAKKCVLLCSNCHKEVHAGLVDIPEDYNTDG